MFSIDQSASVSAAEISRNFGEWQSRALIRPVVITHHGRARLILQSVDHALSQNETSATSAGSTGEVVRLKGELCSILGQMEEGFLSFCPNGLVMQMNRVAELYFGVAKDDVLGRDLKDILPQTRDSMTWSYIARVQKSGGAFDFSVRSKIHPNSLFHAKAFPHGDGVALIFTNVTEDDEARADQKWWEAVQASAKADPASAIIRLNVRGGLMKVDQNFCEMTGFAEAQLQALLLTEIVHPHQRLALAHAINSCLTGSASAPTVARFMTANGEERRLRLSMSAMLDGSIPQGLVVRVLNLDHEQLAA